MRVFRRVAPVLTLAVLTFSAGIFPTRAARADDDEGHETEALDDDEPAQVAIGERLFQETRFAHFFWARSRGDVNASLSEGDPSLATTAHPDGDLPGAFAGRTMSCRVCHMVDEQRRTPGGGIRTYADFATRSPVPLRDEDDELRSVRNAPSLVDAPRGRGLLHFDGEFPSMTALVAGTLTGRNYGWLPSEHAIAVAHVAAVVRGDDGRGALAREFGGAYKRLFRGRSRTIPAGLRLPRRFRLDVDSASDEAILRVVSRLIAAYVRSLAFARNARGEHTGSPFDRFLERNDLPRTPGRRSPRAYTRLLARRIGATGSLQFVSGTRRSFTTHDQDFVFDREALRGFRIFADPERGNCLACHPAPRFTDFGFHDTGVAQVTYDAIHGAGGFAALTIPDLDARNADVNATLPPTPAHPDATGRFRAIPRLDRPGWVDLGLWNVFRHPDFPDTKHQRRLRRMICRAMGRTACREADGDSDRFLAAAIGLFKTPSLRDLGHSAPYFHDGSARTLESTIEHYVTIGEMARAGALRNGDPTLGQIHLAADDVGPLAAFLRALNEDYD